MKLLDKIETINKLNTLMDTHTPIKLDFGHHFDFFEVKIKDGYYFDYQGSHGIFSVEMFYFFRKFKSSTFDLLLIDYADGNYIMITRGSNDYAYLFADKTKKYLHFTLSK